jgi:hypothetical protein
MLSSLLTLFSKYVTLAEKKVIPSSWNFHLTSVSSSLLIIVVWV